MGRVFPFSSECSVEALNAEIKARFKHGPDKTEVMAGDFEIFKAKDSDQVLTTYDPNGLLPGMLINMAIVLEKEFERRYCAAVLLVSANGVDIKVRMKAR